MEEKKKRLSTGDTEKRNIYLACSHIIMVLQNMLKMYLFVWSMWVHVYAIFMLLKKLLTLVLFFLLILNITFPFAIV